MQKNLISGSCWHPEQQAKPRPDFLSVSSPLLLLSSATVPVSSSPLPSAAGQPNPTRIFHLAGFSLCPCSPFGRTFGRRWAFGLEQAKLKAFGHHFGAMDCWLLGLLNWPAWKLYL
jgi:hypothetical protein